MSRLKLCFACWPRTPLDAVRGASVVSCTTCTTHPRSHSS
ncbi:hypothetical protein DWB68_10900 [Galactobacter valiniphilus]|uniref:Uncharacterized protein n=1 Tax=Galactobacter valiniphilus TaxID=2676122 RepID=A0A399J8E4_9MICC|nr:hypothetical protein DWB68_10900 [Galactobacter valiniphilus]